MVHRLYDFAAPREREVSTVEAVLSCGAAYQRGLEALVRLVMRHDHGLITHWDFIKTGHAVYFKVFIDYLLRLERIPLYADQGMHYCLAGSLLHGIFNVFVVAGEKLGGPELRKDGAAFHRRR